MDRKIRVAAIGDNCIDYYDSLNESYPGGNPVNVAVYIKRLGGESSYTGAVGTDSFGKIMISAIQNKGVDTSHIQVLDGKTAVTHVDIVDGDRVFGKYEEGVLADFKLREQDISFIKKHDLAVTGIWGMIEDELPLISKEIPVAFDFANKFANPIVEKAIPYVTYAFFSFDEESRNEFRQKYHSMSNDEETNNLIVFCKTPRTRKEICDYLGLNSVTYAIQTYVNPLVEAGVIKLSIPDKPKSPKQLYYSVEREE